MAINTRLVTEGGFAAIIEEDDKGGLYTVASFRLCDLTAVACDPYIADFRGIPFPARRIRLVVLIVSGHLVKIKWRDERMKGQLDDESFYTHSAYAAVATLDAAMRIKYPEKS